MNQRRSLTAEHVFADEPGLETRSAGTARRDDRAVTAEILAWAEVIFPMDQRHLDWLMERFGPDALAGKSVHVLGVPDEYRFMDKALVALLRERAGPLIWGDR